MNRGIFSLIANTEAYKNSKKEWVIELQTYHQYWYDLIVNPHEVADHLDSRKFIITYLKHLKKQIEDGLEKRFVYFICSRERVRFNTKKAISYNPITGTTKLHILLGRNQIKKAIRCNFLDAISEKAYKPKLEISDKYITITNKHNHKVTYSIHDFLDHAGISMGLYSRVEYVGYTKNPESRPTNGGHTGLSDTLHRLADDGRDSFIYFNLFKVIFSNNRYLFAAKFCYGKCDARRNRRGSRRKNHREMLYLLFRYRKSKQKQAE